MNASSAGLRLLDPLALLTLIGTALWTAARLPERVALHFGLDGLPDRFGSRQEGLLALGLLCGGLVLVYALLRLLPRWDGAARRNRGVLEQTASVLLVFGAVLVGGIAQSMLTGTAYGIERLILAALGLLFAVLGSALPRTRPNRWVGLRVAYTLSSDLAWERVHRTGGWWLTVYGLTLLGLSLVPLEGVAWLGLLSLPVCMPMGVLLLNAQARHFWQMDPHRRPVR